MKRNELWNNEDFRRIAEFSGITEESSKNDFDYFVESFQDATIHGCESGCLSAFIYTDDNMRFFDLHRDRIAYVVFELNEVSLSDICHLHEINDQEIVCQSGIFKNYLTWAYVECVGNSLIDDLEDYLTDEIKNIGR